MLTDNQKIHMQLAAKPSKYKTLIIISLLAISAFTHAFNMFGYPYYENDEGTYMSQSWSLIKHGELAPYTYWYDHAPLGWIFISFWVFLTGGFFTFGNSINSGRVFMLIIHIAISIFLVAIAKKIKKDSELVGALTVLVFSLSPLAIYFQRRVLLDNLMIFWILLSLLTMLVDKLKLVHIILSAIFFGFAVLTKENAIIFLPGFIYIIWTLSHKHYRKFAIVNWLTISILLISTYFLYAVLKKELFPVGFFGDEVPRVSLITTLQSQFDRGNNLPFWNTKSDFYVNFTEWVKMDAFTMIIGISATIINVYYYTKFGGALFIPLLTILFFIFLMRGKLVNNFYIIPAIPLLALNIGLFFDRLISSLLANKSSENTKIAAFIAITPVFILLSFSTDQYFKNETDPQVQAIEWLKSNLPETTKLVIDDSIYVDLHEPRFPGDKTFPFADWSWKVEKDPEVYLENLQGDWKNIEYIVLSHEMLKQIREERFNFIQQGLDNSFLVIDWSKDSTSYIDIENYISTNGDWMAVYKVNDLNRIELSKAWKYYKSNFIKSYGQIVDPTQNDATTSEGQSYAMLRAVWQNDKKTFDGVWKWTKDHLQHRKQDKLISWLWVKENGEYKLGDSGSASDADSDIALSLLFAAKRWRNSNYYKEARDIIKDIWKLEVKRAGNRYILLPGVSGFETQSYYIVNPSYLSPASYRIFSEVDPENNWMALANDSYSLLNDIPNLPGKPILPPNWLLVDKLTGVAVGYPDQINLSQEYGYDAFRIFWRVSLDKQWFNTKESIDYLSKYNVFFLEELKIRGKISATYSVSGNPTADYSSISTLSAPLSIFYTLREPSSQEIFETNFNSTNGYWGDKNNYYDQNWGWFSTALYRSLLPNLWEQQELAKY